MHLKFLKSSQYQQYKVKNVSLSAEFNAKQESNHLLIKLNFGNFSVVLLSVEMQ